MSEGQSARIRIDLHAVSTTVNVIRIEVALCVVGVLEIQITLVIAIRPERSHQHQLKVVTSWALSITEEKLQVTAKTTDRKTHLPQTYSNQRPINCKCTQLTLEESLNPFPDPATQTRTQNRAQNTNGESKQLEHVIRHKKLVRTDNCAPRDHVQATRDDVQLCSIQSALSAKYDLETLQGILSRALV